jgi:hypothetical protein
MLIQNSMHLFFANFGPCMLVLAIIIATVSQWRSPDRPAAETFFRWIVLLPLGLKGIYTFVMHAFFGAYIDNIVLWDNNAFQYEAAVANFAFGVLGMLAYRASYDFRLATVIGTTCWLWGDAAGQIYLMANDKTSLMDVSPSFWWQILIPLLLILLFVRIPRGIKKIHSVNTLNNVNLVKE